MIRREITLFLVAVQFLTRVPTPQIANFDPAWISRSARYFPIVGQIVGAISALAFVMASHRWSGLIPALLAVTTGIVLTGAFHEDGLADTADGLGGGRDRAQRLAIMKDSRLGTYGTLALGLCLALKVAALASLQPAAAIMILIAAHGGGRAVAVLVMHALPYAGDPDAAKVKPTPVGVTRTECAIAVATALWPLVLITHSQIILGGLCGLVLAAVIVLAARRLIGGQTGDILGAIEQMFELGFLLGATATIV